LCGIGIIIPKYLLIRIKLYILGVLLIGLLRL